MAEDEKDQKTVHISGRINLPGGEKLRYSLWTMPYLSKEKSDQLLAVFADPEFPLVSNPVVRTGVCHRRVGFFSNDSNGYRFAGQIAASLPLDTHPSMPKLLKRVNEFLGTRFNGILINHYRKDQNDSIGAHADDENTLSDGTVAAISLGVSRKFRITGTGKSIIDIPTGHGQLLVMDGIFQQIFKHGIPVEKKVSGDRVSLTFRVHVPDKKEGK